MPASGSESPPTKSIPLAESPIITLTTDFGEASRYVAAMKGVILSINPTARLVDLSHSIPPQDIAAGARFLAEASRWFPPGTIHLAVIDPGVGSDRAIIAAQINGQVYVCPDNGLLTNLAESAVALRINRIESPQHRLPVVSQTFHGRDIMAPAAAHLSLGIDPSQLGAEQDRSHLVRLELASPSIYSGDMGVAQKIEGEVIEVDSFGNLITNITSEMLTAAPTGPEISIVCDEHETMGLQSTYADQPPMTLVALIGSSDQLELAIVNESAAMMLGIKVGTAVVVKW